MRGRDLIMWPEGQWEASQKIALGGDRQTDRYIQAWTSRLLESIGLRFNSLKKGQSLGFFCLKLHSGWRLMGTQPFIIRYSGAVLKFREFQSQILLRFLNYNDPTDSLPMECQPCSIIKAYPFLPPSCPSLLPLLIAAPPFIMKQRGPNT